MNKMHAGRLKACRIAVAGRLRITETGITMADAPSRTGHWPLGDCSDCLGKTTSRKTRPEGDRSGRVTVIGGGDRGDRERRSWPNLATISRVDLGSTSHLLCGRWGDIGMLLLWGVSSSNFRGRLQRCTRPFFCKATGPYARSASRRPRPSASC